jgi:hypothetical protein
MGGRGSGRQWGTVRGTTAECPALDVRRLQKGELLLPGRSFPCEWTESGKKVASVYVRTYEDRIELSYDHLGAIGWKRQHYAVSLEWLPCHYGGRRPWFRCPAIGCGRRVAIIYGRGPFACRQCHRLAYPSQRLVGFRRAVNRAQAIRKRLGGTANLFEPFPKKPKGMHWRTFLRLRDHYEDANAASWPGWIRRLAKASG